MTTPLRDRDALVLWLANTQFGIVSRGQMLACGLSTGCIDLRVARGRYHRVGRGVYAIGHVALSREGRCMASLLEAGPGAALSHRTAANFHGIWEYHGVVDVLSRRRRRSSTGTRAHQTRSLEPGDVVFLHGMWMTSLPRSIVDLAEVLSAHWLVKAIKRAIVGHGLDLDEVVAVARRLRTRSSHATLVEALRLLRDGSGGFDTQLERRALAALERGCIDPLPVTNHEVVVDGVRCRIDMAWPALRLAFEVDGPHHKHPVFAREDAMRAALLRSVGWQVERCPDETIRYRPDRFIAQAAAALARVAPR